jgi:hypothetical protein
MAKSHGRRLSALSSLLLLALMLSGCEHVIRNLQYSNIRTGLFPMIMSLTLNEGRTDARSLMKGMTWESSVERPDVSVHYPLGMADQAARLADAFQQTKDDVKKRTGITWAFKPDVYLVPVSNLSGGFRLRIPIRKTRVLRVPMLVRPGTPAFFLTDWSHGLAHELTEASMLSSLDRHEVVLGDSGALGVDLINRTRWFRDGVSDYAGDLMNARLFGDRYQPPSWIYRSLMTRRADVLDWSNCGPRSGDYTNYSASEALVQELINHSGEDAIARIFHTASREKYIDGGTLDRAVKKVTGLDLQQFVSGYRMTWLGADLADSALSDTPFIAQPGNVVHVTRVHPGTPAQKWKLKPGDQIVAVGGHAVVSSAWLIHYLAACRPRQRIEVGLLVDGKPVSYRMVTARRYDDQL